MIEECVRHQPTVSRNHTGIFISPEQNANTDPRQPQTNQPDDQQSKSLTHSAEPPRTGKTHPTIAKIASAYRYDRKILVTLEVTDYSSSPAQSSLHANKSSSPQQFDPEYDPALRTSSRERLL